jgi:hypothetical protein
MFDAKGHRITRGNPFRGRADGVFAITRSFSNADPKILGPSLDFLPFDPRPAPNLVVVRNPSSPRQLAVRNVGTAAAGRSTLALSNPSASFSIPALEPGRQSAYVTTPCGASRIATADATGQVAESNEADNSAAYACR